MKQSAATYLRGSEDRQVAEAVMGMKSLEARLVETPISRGRAVLADYGVPYDILMWEGADPEAPNQKQCLKMLRAKQKERMGERLMARVIHGVYAK